MKHRIYLNFTINDFEDISHEEISQKLGMKPYKIYVKGEKRNPNFPASGPFWRANRWIMASPFGEYHSFEDQMNATLDIIEPKFELYRCEFACAVYLRFDNGESIPSIYLGSRYNQLIKELNIAFDVDLYVFHNHN
jgi:Domain of unknown function (DUF4279)